jgi:hypothetical protein
MDVSEAKVEDEDVSEAANKPLEELANVVDILEGAEVCENETETRTTLDED